MFTGIIEEVGIINNIKKGAKSAILTLACSKILEDLKLGDSVATNGVCLTVTAISNASFSADVMNETLLKSSLGSLNSGSRVNLERAMPVNGRFGGHIVSGHIDGTGKIVSIKKDDIAIWYTIKTSPGIMQYIIEKGSIVIDGISLTIAKITHDSFSVSVIPYTAKYTTLSEKKIGCFVNLENDIIGKYIEKFTQNSNGINKELLIKNGF
ncbi:riboflavin synthase subunit alpha [Anaerocolumna cellulosilytica]|uniref:Riboflavin synthase n=1 Tax=Anaerocolumna cellulosilytica TaxID=433286 RepID=A0A6S6R1S6_9FIRM|nr:riboflavin synthase [Anaerocolumna cellulosilytica]MBB5197850.1 riboflavin synthase [Anaerocolumna cellulosilytica]BCJ93161.1 riboflavin synthase subunit alpha [Anaerocolumna cellulosilytica]